MQTEKIGCFPGILVPGWSGAKYNDAEQGASLLVLSHCICHTTSSHAQPALKKLPRTQNLKSRSKEEGYN